MPTLAELNAQQAALTLALAEHELPRHEEASEILAELGAHSLVTRLTALAGELPDSGAKGALGNIEAAITAAAGLINAHLPRLRELASDQTEQES